MKRYVMKASRQELVLSSARDPQTGHPLGRLHHDRASALTPKGQREGLLLPHIRKVSHGMGLFGSSAVSGLEADADGC